MFGTLGKKKAISHKSSTADGIIKQSSNGLPTIYWTDEKSILTLKEKEKSIALEQAGKSWKFNRLHFLFFLSPIGSHCLIIQREGKTYERFSLWRLTPLAGPRWWRHTCTPPRLRSQLYTRWGWMMTHRYGLPLCLGCSALFCPRLVRTSLCVWQHQQLGTQKTTMLWTRYKYMHIFTGTGMDAVYAWARTDV